MSDIISRQDVLDILRNLAFDYTFQCGEYYGEDERQSTIINTEKAIDVIENLPSAELEQKWIPVTERLPKKENKSYWVCTDTKYQCECRWTNNMYGIGKSNNYGWSIFDIPQYTKVVAWMPLPEVYRGE